MLGLIELVVVLMFVVGWAVIELVALRIDRRKKERASSPATPTDPQ